MQPRVGSISPIIGPCRGLDRLDHPPSLPLASIPRPIHAYTLVGIDHGISNSASQTVKLTKYTQSVRLSLQSSELGPPSPHPQASVAPPLVPGGGGNTRLRERGRGKTIRTNGQTLWYSCILSGINPLRATYPDPPPPFF
jgi:hypothetical protein